MCELQTVYLSNSIQNSNCAQNSPNMQERSYWRIRISNPDLILEQRDVVVRGLRVEFSLSLQVELQRLHVEPEVSGVRVTLRRITAETAGR